MNKIKKIIESITEPDNTAVNKAEERLNKLTKPVGSLGQLEEIAKKLAGITANPLPRFRNKVVFTFASDYGIAKEGVSAYPQEVTAQMVYNFLGGGAAINVLSKQAGARVVIADLGVASELKPHDNLLSKKIAVGTRNFCEGPAMTEEQAIKSIETGIEIFEQELERGADIVCTGEMGIGNTTAASAITTVITGKNPREVTGRGTGASDSQFLTKIRTIEKGIHINKPDKNNAIDILHKLGGFEIGALAGLILAAAARRIPVVLDGFISGAAALVADKFAPRARHFMIAGHLSFEPGHVAILNYLQLEPILRLDMRLGEGTGAALALSIIEASCRIINEMATFKEAGISEKQTE